MMDFLDPRKRRAHHRRLIVGYILVAIALIMGTGVLVLLSYGYDLDRKTGNVIQNGLVFAGAHPGAADIYLDGVKQSSRTDTKLILAAGQYTIEYKRDGYRSWTRAFSLQGGSVQHLDYAFMFPTNLQTNDVELYSSTPAFSTQSPDRHWLLVQQPGQFIKFDVFDLNSDNTTLTSLSLPANIVTASSDPNQTWQAPEWSTDNRHVLIDHHYSNNDEYIMVDRENPAQSFNVNQLFKITPTQVALHNKRYDQLYVYTANGGVLQTADVSTATLTPFLTHVLAFKPHDDKTVLYVSDEAAKPGQVTLKLYSGGNIYTLRQLPSGPSYLLDLARYDNRWYMVAGTSGDNRIYIYQDPENTLKQKNENPALLTAIVLNITNPQHISFSDTAQFIAAQSGTHFAVYDAESDRRYYYDINLPLPADSRAVWMDGNRLTLSNQGKTIIFDYDGINMQTLSATDDRFPATFDRDYKWLYNIGPSGTVVGRAALTRTELTVK